MKNRTCRHFICRFLIADKLMQEGKVEEGMNVYHLPSVPCRHQDGGIDMDDYPVSSQLQH